MILNQLCNHLWLASNVLVHQKCNCPSAVQCTCHDNPIKYVVGDLDLLCFEGTSSTMKFEDWIMTHHDPAGTIEMKPPEVCNFIEDNKCMNTAFVVLWNTLWQTCMCVCTCSYEAYFKVASRLYVYVNASKLIQLFNQRCHDVIMEYLPDSEMLWWRKF